MKTLLLVLFCLFSVSASAEDQWSDVYRCHAGSGEAAQSLEIQVSVEGIYIGKATQSWFGGTHDSGWVMLEWTSRSGAMTTTVFENKDLGFSAEIVQAFGASPTGRKLGNVVQGSFRDPKSGMAGVLLGMTCN